MPMVIAFISQKGGVGKSTLARALAREAAAGGLSVKIADLDTQQGTAVDWHRQRLDSALEPLSPSRPSRQPPGACRRWRLRSPDRRRPRAHQQRDLEIARVADLVVQPTGASTDDLRPAIREFHALHRLGSRPASSSSRSTASGLTARRPRRTATSPRRGTPPCPAACLSAPPTVRRRTSASP